MPAKNTEFWQEKFERNIARDQKVHAELVAAGWRVFIVWECALKRPDQAAEAVRSFAHDLSSNG